MSDPLDEKIKAAITRARGSTLATSDFLIAVGNPIVSDLSPWELWALVGFLRHERRQKWVGFIVESKLRASGSELATSGAFAHPEETGQEGNVPDLPDWHYFFHGSGCCLRHNDGTTIDVDFADDGSALEIDPYFYLRFLETAPNLDWSDARLRYAAPLENVWHFDLRRLAALQLIQQKWRFRLTEKGRQLGERLEPVVDEINRLTRDGSDPSRLVASWLVAVLGDLPGAVEMLGSQFGEIAVALKPAAFETLQRRVTVVRASGRSRGDSERKLALNALAALGREHVEPEIWRALEQSPPCSVHLLCLRIVESWCDPSCESKLLAVLDRFAARTTFFTRLLGRSAPEKDEIERPRNGTLVATARIVFSYETPNSISSRARDALLRVVEGDRKACDAEAGFMLHLLAPDKGLTKLQANLRNRVPITRSEAAIFLGMIGTDKAIDALIQAAAFPPEHGGLEAASVLAMLADSRAAQAGAEWQRRNDGYEEAEGREINFNGRTIKTWSADDMLRTTTRDTVQHWSERVKKQYGPILARWTPNA